MNAQIREAAAYWLVEFRTDSPDVAARHRFAAWLRTSPEHIRAYLEALALWENAHGYDPQHRLDISTLVTLARADSTITDLPTESSPAGASYGSPRPVRWRRLRPYIAVAALLSLLINGAVVWFAMNSHTAAYTTQIAEQRSVQLADGSQAYLDASSDIRVNFTRQERTVELLSGQALFRVTKDPQRPFVVHVNDARIRAVGTEFDVNRTSMGNIITVLEGRVLVLPAVRRAKGTRAGFDPAGVAVNAGQKTTVTGGTIAMPQAANTVVAVAWTRSVLLFASTPLSEVAAEFNRFNSRQLVVASRELASFPVTGTFYASNPQSLSDFVVFLRKQPGIEVLEEGSQITVQIHSSR